jgi:hypothetical protein
LKLSARLKRHQSEAGADRKERLIHTIEPLDPTTAHLSDRHAPLARSLVAIPQASRGTEMHAPTLLSLAALTIWAVVLTTAGSRAGANLADARVWIGPAAFSIAIVLAVFLDRSHRYPGAETWEAPKTSGPEA